MKADMVALKESPLNTPFYTPSPVKTRGPPSKHPESTKKHPESIKITKCTPKDHLYLNQDLHLICPTVVKDVIIM
jgi:hypothetical protein